MKIIDAERPQNKHLIHDSETQRKRATKHGYYKEPWYQSYKAMMQRCYTKSSRNYAVYGGRGIIVCDEWHDIHKFAEWTKQSGYKCGLTIDRIDVNGNYSPENCRWATKKEQANNKRNNVFYEYNRVKHTLAEWARIYGINRHTLWSRINKYGWTIEKALGGVRDAESVRHGHWIEANDGTHYCSNCGHDAPFTWDDIDRNFMHSADEVPDFTANYCYCCGAKMMDEVSE